MAAMINDTRANLFASNGKLAVTILDLSSDCALVELASPPPAGSIAILVRNRMRICCTVGWAAGSEIGLMFEEPLDGMSLADFVGGAAEASRPLDRCMVAA